MPLEERYGVQLLGSMRGQEAFLQHGQLGPLPQLRQGLPRVPVHSRPKSSQEEKGDWLRGNKSGRGVSSGLQSQGGCVPLKGEKEGRKEKE